MPGKEKVRDEQGQVVSAQGRGKGPRRMRGQDEVRGRGPIQHLDGKDAKRDRAGRHRRLGKVQAGQTCAQGGRV